MKRRGFVVEEVPAMGNCMFESLSRQLARFGTVLTHEEVRAAAVSFIEKNHMVRSKNRICMCISYIYHDLFISLSFSQCLSLLVSLCLALSLPRSYMTSTMNTLIIIIIVVHSIKCFH